MRDGRKRQPRLGLVAGAALMALACTAALPAAPAARGGPPVPSSAAAANAVAPAPPAPLERVRSAYTTVSATSAVWWTAVDAGYAREQGIDMALGRVEAGAPLQAAFVNGELDISGGSGQATILAHLQGLDSVLIGTTVKIMEGNLFVRPEIQTIDDLRGKVVAVNRPRAVSDISARVALQRLGLRPDTDVAVRGVGGQAESLLALENSTAAGASLSVPFVFEARARGYRELLDVSSLKIPFLNGSVSSTRRYVAAKPEAVERTMRALAQALHRLKTDREWMMQIMGKYTGVEDTGILAATADYYMPLYAADPYPDPEAVQNTMEHEDHPGIATLRPAEVTYYEAAERLRSSGFLDQLWK